MRPRPACAWLLAIAATVAGVCGSGALAQEPEAPPPAAVVVLELGPERRFRGSGAGAGVQADGNAGGGGAASHMTGIMLSAVGGSLSATGANVMAWSAFRERTEGAWSPRASATFVVLCVALNLTGIGFFALATQGGAVATVMPIQTGANLLANMFWQIFLGMKHFTKVMRIGTLVLLCAVVELAELGPREPENLDVGALMLKPVAIAWTAVLVACTAGGLVACSLTYSQPQESVAKLVSFTAVVSLTTVIGSSVSKCFSLVTGPALYAILLVYFVVGVGCLTFTVLANKLCDVSIYIPAQLSSQLVLNMFTGFFVWGDAANLDRPVSYIMVYVISILGVYLISQELDVIGDWIRMRQINQTRLSAGVAVSAVGEAALELLSTWRVTTGRKTVEDERLREMCARAIQKVLSRGKETGAITDEEIIRLTLRLLADEGLGPSAVLVQWLEEDVRYFGLLMEQDPCFQRDLRDTLSPEERRKLPPPGTATVLLRTLEPEGPHRQLQASAASSLSARPPVTVELPAAARQSGGVSPRGAVDSAAGR